MLLGHEQRLRIVLQTLVSLPWEVLAMSNDVWNLPSPCKRWHGALSNANYIHRQTLSGLRAVLHQFRFRVNVYGLFKM